jgi:DNA-binding Xre family transcriptional regulator
MKTMAFADNLKKLIADRGLKLTVISAATGIPMSTLSEWTAGREPKISEALVRLCRYLGVSLDRLVISGECENSDDEIAAQAVVHIEGVQYRLQFLKIK